MPGKVDKRRLVSVYGSGVKAPLLQTNDARLIQVRNSSGELVAMMYKLTDTLWGFSARGDADWEDHRRRLEIDDAGE